MLADRWYETLARMTAHDAEEIDDLLRDHDPRSPAPGRDVFPPIAGVLLPQTRFKDPRAICVGFRVATPLPDPTDHAMRLLGFALERDVDVVVLSHLGYSGFERFGFRVERVTGDTEAARAQCEQQICRFWNIDLVL